MVRCPETEHLFDQTMAHLVFSPRGYQAYTFLAFEDVFAYIRMAQSSLARAARNPSDNLEMVQSAVRDLDVAVSRARLGYVAAARQRFALDPALVHEVESRRGIYQASGPTSRSCYLVRTLLDSRAVCIRWSEHYHCSRLKFMVLSCCRP